jgi:hypothetical protein
MSELERDLRATGADIEPDAARLKEIEDEKSRLGAGNPRAIVLSREAEVLARGLVPKTAAERELNTTAADTDA